jgi:hypothetical protein
VDETITPVIDSLNERATEFSKLLTDASLLESWKKASPDLKTRLLDLVKRDSDAVHTLIRETAPDRFKKAAAFVEKAPS